MRRWRSGRYCLGWAPPRSPRSPIRCTSEYDPRSGASQRRCCWLRTAQQACKLAARGSLLAAPRCRKRHYKGKTKKTAVVIAIVAAALGLAGVFGVLHSVLAAEDVGAAVWAATCVLWAGFLGVIAQQLGWKDSAASSAAASQRRRRYAAASAMWPCRFTGSVVCSLAHSCRLPACAERVRTVARPTGLEWRQQIYPSSSQRLLLVSKVASRPQFMMLCNLCVRITQHRRNRLSSQLCLPRCLGSPRSPLAVALDHRL